MSSVADVCDLEQPSALKDADFSSVELYNAFPSEIREQPDDRLGDRSHDTRELLSAQLYRQCLSIRIPSIFGFQQKERLGKALARALLRELDDLLFGGAQIGRE